jgi:photosystem II stability/assembly factor-like uncharacterized protein
MKIYGLFLVLMLCLVSLSVIAVRADNDPHETVLSAPAKDEVRKWEVTGPFGGDVRTMVVAPDNPDLLYLGTGDGQLFRSIDGAITWQRLKPGIGKRGLVIDNIEFDPRNTQVMYAGTWDGNSSMNSEMGVYKSEDGGNTWKLLKDTKGIHILSIVISPSDSNFLLAGSRRNLFRSTNAGKDWESIPTDGYPEIRNINSLALDPQNTNIIYVGTNHLPWKSNDGGKTWKQNGAAGLGMLDDSDIMGITVNQADPKLVYVNACSGIYRSTTAGEKWTKVPGIPFSARRTYALLPHPLQPNTIFAGTSEGLWRTKDGGKRWMLLTSKTTVLRSVVVHPDKPNRVIIATDDFGVQISNDLGDSFTDANNGFINRHILAFMPHTVDRGRILASVYHDSSAGSVFASNDGGETWEPSSKGLGGRDVFTFHQSIENPSVVYAGTNAGVYRSDDRGASWSFVGIEQVKVEKPEKKPVARPKTKTKKRAAVLIPSTDNATTKIALSSNAFGRYQSVAVQKKSSGKAKAQTRKPVTRKPVAKKPVPEPVEEQPLGPPLLTLTKQVDGLAQFTDAEGRTVLLAAASDGLYKTLDETRGWEKVSVGDYDYNGRVFSISTHKGIPGKIYIGTKRGLYVSTDFAGSWTHLDKGPTEATVKAIAQAANDPDNMLIGTNQFVYRSTNGGRTWIKKGGGLPAGDFTAVAINPYKSDEMMVAEYLKGGIYRSKDKGISWEKIDAELPSSRVWALMFDPFERDKVYAGSFSSGVYILTIQKGVTASGQ